jgi:plastocyanin
MNVQRMLGLVLVAAVCAACGGGSGGNSPTSPSNNNGSGTPAATPATPASNQVIATSESTFNPTALTVTAGTAVTFTFEGVTHDVVFDNVTGAPADISNTAGTSVSRTFASRGTFPFQCTIHSGMRGAVTVN